MQNCISVDWLTLHVRMPRKAGALVNTPFEQTKCKYVINRDIRQTRHFKSIYYIYNGTDEIATLACDPHSEILQEDSGLLKINNKYLYQQNLYDFVVAFLKELGLEFRSISRIDIALDFLKFNNNLNPENFIKGFHSSKYIKVGKSKYSSSGSCGDAKLNRHETLKFGSPTSDTIYYLYNKKKELEQVKMKPWITENWRANGWDGEADVWRLEFSLKPTTAAIIDPTDSGGEVDEITGQLKGEQIFLFKDLTSIKRLDAVYNFYFNKYFSFVFNEKKVRKDRCKPLKLFASYIKCAFVKIELSIKKQATRATKIFAKALQSLNNEMRGYDTEFAIMTNELLSFVVASRGIEDWAKKRLNFEVTEKQQANFRGKDTTRFVFSLCSSRAYDRLHSYAPTLSYNPVIMLREMYGTKYAEKLKELNKGL